MEKLKPSHIACTKSIKIGEYFQKFSQDVKDLKKSANIKVNSETNIEDICSIDKLNCEGEGIQTADKNKLGNTFQCNSSESAGHLNIQRVKVKWEDILEHEKTTLSFPLEPMEDELDRNDLTPEKDIVLTVRYYRPFANKSQHQNRCQAHYIAEIAVLAKQSLVQLRDKFKCVHDYYISTELEHPDDKSICYTKDDFPSSFIFIGNCFYNDMRHPKAIDYSYEVIEWAANKKIAIYTSAKMEDTKIQDLNIRIGYPYVFQHHGNCEHLVVFTDARLLRPGEILDSQKYPYILSTNKFRTTCCAMCQHSYADFHIIECDRLPKKHNYLCKNCVLAYNYHDGKKVGTFRLFPYFDMNLLAFF